ncbi:hypothetical protein ACCD10_22395 [Pseudomonas sp. Pseusp122]|uniref:hypothetical protein n=1 Tax=unclassified Pseudomonas TaxID=196821 RepID=UPI0039A5C7DD
MNLMLALDTLESVKRSTRSSLLWQQLAIQAGKLQGNERQRLLEDIAACPLESAEAEWLRCSAMAELTHDTAWYARQALQASEATLPDALMSLLGLAWHHGLARTQPPTAMVHALQKIDLPRLQSLVARQLPRRQATEPRQPPGRLRIAIYTPHVANPTHGGTMFTLNVMSALNEDLADIHTFAAQENNIPAVGSYHGGNEAVQPVIVQPETLRLKRPGHCQLLLPDVEFSVRARFEQMRQAIDDFAPDVVFFVGFLSPLIFDLYERYPVVGLSIHSLPPLAPVDVWLSADPEANAACWPGLPVPQTFDFPQRFWPGAPVTPIDRGQLGLPVSATLLISVGFRLEVELTPEWQERMLQLLERHPDVHWLLVGVREEIPSDALPQHVRIYRAPLQSHIEAWLAASDIFINPPRIGGGSAVALAMEQGLAVASMNTGDGGDKLGPYGASSVDDYFTRLQAWVEHPELRREIGAALKTRFHERLDFSTTLAAQGLLAACNQAIAAFQQRKETACD